MSRRNITNESSNKNAGTDIPRGQTISIAKAAEVR
jgi:hypothetical protein